MTTIASPPGEWPEDQPPGRVENIHGREPSPVGETNFVGLDELLAAGAEAAPLRRTSQEARRHCVSWHGITHQLLYGRRGAACRIFAILLTTSAVLVTAALLLGETGLQTAIGLVGFLYLLRHRQHQLASIDS
ncbi:hypothetical protein [Amycolatopsis magusensis]|uniref:hypothetical protein n=1 Tax=Amycolatopsis magusensis TaxID=882444 RepID=UPI0037B75279